MNRSAASETGHCLATRVPRTARAALAAQPARNATGTQAIERAILLMKLLATRGRFGWGLTEIARRSGLDKATVRRILRCLEIERLVDRDFGDRRYFPGALLAELGLSTFGYQQFFDAGRAAIGRLSKRTGGASFLYLRSGDEFVVAGRVEESPHRGMLNEQGFRRPLVSSAGGVAILIELPARERRLIVQRNHEDLARMSTHRPERFNRVLERSLKAGFAVNLEDVATGINSFAVAIPDHTGAPFASISVAGEPHRFPAAEGARFAELLSQEVVGLRAKAAELFPRRELAASPDPDIEPN